MNRIRGIAETSDSALFDRVCASDEEAIKDLIIRRCGPRLKYLAFRFDYEELPQDLYVLLCEDNWSRLKTWRGTGPLVNWVLATANNMCLQRYRKKGPVLPFDPDLVSRLCDDRLSDPIEPMIEQVRRSELLEAIEGLRNERQRLIIMLTVLREPPKTTREVAELLRITENNLFKLKHDALKKLRQALARKGWQHV